jgi:sugar lactone lactonase YvrE
MIEYEATVASEDAFRLGESPRWNVRTQRPLWVDVAHGEVLIGDYRSGRVTVRQRLCVDTTVGAVFVSHGDDVVVAGSKSIHVLDSEGRLRARIGVLPAERSRRLNDGCCDPAGRLLVGSLALDGRCGQEELWRLDSHTLTVIDDDLTLSNGLGWSPGGDVLYTVDSIPGAVWARPYDAASGDVGPRRLQFSVTDGAPDGLCIDDDGCLWLAVWGTGQVRRYTPDGRVLATITVPAPHVTAAAFIGSDLTTLMITTAYDGLSAQQRAAYPLSGRLFLAEVPTGGPPATAWRGPGSQLDDLIGQHTRKQTI